VDGLACFLSRTDRRKLADISSERGAEKSFPRLARLSLKIPSTRDNRKEAILPKFILLDEFHIEVRIPHRTRDAQGIAMKRILDSVEFHTRIRRAARDVLRQYPAFKLARIRVSR
jgi:hypothetical protein